MQNQKGFILLITIVIIVIAVLGVTGFVAYKYFVPKEENQVLCEDSDNGNDLYVKGTVNFSQSITFKEGSTLQVVSDKNVFLSLGKEVKNISLNELQSFNLADEAYYLKTDGTNAGVIVDVPTTILIKKINYVGDKNPNNSIEAIIKSTNIDSCINDILVENTCDRGINNGYLCEKGCSDGVCIK